MRIIAPLFILALAACGSEPERTVVSESGSRVSYAVDGDGELTADARAADGKTASVRSGRDVDVDLPEGFALYPGAEVLSNASVAGAEGTGAMITMTTADPAEEVMAYYRRQAEAAGVTIGTTMSSGDTHMIAGEGTEGTAFSANATRQGDQTTVILTVGMPGG